MNYRGQFSRIACCINIQFTFDRDSFPLLIGLALLFPISNRPRLADVLTLQQIRFRPGDDSLSNPNGSPQKRYHISRIFRGVTDKKNYVPGRSLSEDSANSALLNIYCRKTVSCATSSRRNYYFDFWKKIALFASFRHCDTDLYFEIYLEFIYTYICIFSKYNTFSKSFRTTRTNNYIYNYAFIINLDTYN